MLVLKDAKRVRNIAGAGAIGVLISLFCLVGMGARAAGSNLLWRAYSQGTAEKQKLLQESRRHVSLLKEKASRGEVAKKWHEVPEVEWLLKHRTPAVLVLERQLQEPPPTGRFLDAFLYLAVRLGHSRLTSRLPELLPRAKTTEDRMRVVNMLANLRTEDSVEALRGFLKNANGWTRDELICEAARGLGLTGDAEHLSLLQKVTSLVRDPISNARLLAARHRCGDPKTGARLREMLHRKDVPPGFRLQLLNVLRRAELEEMVPELADMSLKAAKEQMRVAAFDCMVDIVDYHNLPIEQPGKLIEEESGGGAPAKLGSGAEKQPMPTPLTRYRNAGRTKRQKMVAEVIEFWKKESQKKNRALPNRDKAQEPPAQ